MNELHNNHNVYILGAGFSADRGLPLVKNFMFQMRDAYDWLCLQNRNVEAQSIAEVLKFRKDAASAAYRVKIDLENIEELFSLVSASTESKVLSNSIRIAIAATLDYCSQITKPHGYFQLDHDKTTLPTLDKLGYRVANDHNNTIRYHLPPYEFYLSAMLGWQSDAKAENTIISFNYDTVVEETLTKLERGFSYGFSSKAVNYESSQFGRNNDRLKLLKLHGSVNWGRQKKSRGGAGKLTVYDSYASTRAHEAIPELIPPTWRKIFDGNLEGVWLHALDAIKTATRIVVIGFSVPQTDMHFKYLLAAGLQHNISLRDVIFVNPEKIETFQTKIDHLFTNPLYSHATHSACETWSYFHDSRNRDLINRPLPKSYSASRY